MVSRRRFLQVGGVAAIAASPLGPSGEAETKAEPALARLKSRKDEAKPITREERQQRQERARQLMTENELDAILLMEGTSLKYFTGIRWWGGERMFA
jgi:Xaa-Pro dipeptidase